MAKYLKRHFTEVDIQLADKHTKKEFHHREPSGKCKLIAQ